VVEVVVRVVVSLGVVLGLFWLVARLGSRKLGGRDRGLISVRGRQALSRGASLAVVEVGSRVLVVGVSDSGVRLLTEMHPAELAGPATSPSHLLETPAATYDAAFEAAYEAGRTAIADTGTPAMPLTPHPSSRREPAEGALAGSLLTTTTWRQAWETATGRAQRTQDGDAA
jgi:flagellar protein FliO/FliZ